MWKNIMLIIKDFIIAILLSFITIIGVIGILIVILFIPNGGDHQGKDTVESFGNGRFQIIEVHEGKYDSLVLFLWDLKKSTTIEPYINNYEEINGKVYITGENGYTVLDYKKGTYIQSKDLDIFSSEEQELLLELN